MDQPFVQRELLVGMKPAWSDAAVRSIQIFGAIGFTWQMRNHRYFRRAGTNAECSGHATVRLLR